jgi:hypothetical protein
MIRKNIHPYFSLQCLFLAYTSCSLAAATKPSKGFMSTCKSEFLEMESVNRDEYAAGIFTFVTYELLEGKILDNQGYDDLALRKAILKKTGQLRDSYAKHMPPYTALPEPIMNVYVEYCCDNVADQATDTFCYNYFDGTMTAADVPTTSSITDLTYKEAKQASNTICSTVSEYWDGLISNATQFYLSKSLIVPKVWVQDVDDDDSTGNTSRESTPSPSPSGSAATSSTTTTSSSKTDKASSSYVVSPTKIERTSDDDSVEHSSDDESSIGSSSVEMVTVNITSSVTKTSTDMSSQLAVSAGTDTSRKLGSGGVVILLPFFAVLTLLLILFVYLRRKRRDREATFAPIDCSDRYTDGCFIDGEEDDPVISEKELIFT